MTPGDLVQIGGEASFLVALAAIAFGLLNCFFGYRLFKFMLGLYGLLLGALVGFIVASNVTGGQTLWLVLGAVAGGFVGAALMVLLYFVGVFIVGALAGVVLANAIGAAVGVDMPLLVVIVVAVVVGVVALVLQRVVLILATAFSGAWAAVAGSAALLAGESLSLDLLGRPGTWEGADLSLLVFLAAWVGLGIAGAVVQFLTTRPKEPATSGERPPEEPRER